MIKKALIKNLIVVGTVCSSFILTGCAKDAASNTSDLNTEVSVVSEDEVISEDSSDSYTEIEEERSEIALTDESTEVALVDSNTNESVSNVSANKTVAPSSNNVVESTTTTTKQDASTTTGTNTTNKTASVDGNGLNSLDTSKNTVTVSSVPTNVPKTSTSTVPKTDNSSKTSGSTTTTASTSTTPVSNSSSSSKTKKYVDANGVEWDTADECSAANVKIATDRQNSYKTTVTLNNAVTDEVNKRRTENGVGALNSTAETDAAALKRAEEIANDFSHNGGNGAITAGENIQANYGGGASASQVVDNYSDSYGHNASQNATDVGSASSATATVTDADGNIVAQYDVTVFDDIDVTGESWLDDASKEIIANRGW